MAKAKAYFDSSGRLRGAGGKFAKSGVIGGEVVIANLRKQINGIKNRSHRGVLAAALKVQRWSMELTPIDTGNLRASHYTKMLPSINPTAEVGLTASYAPYVHEMTDLHHDTGQAKFLETAVTEHHREILDTIRSHAKVRGA